MSYDFGRDTAAVKAKAEALAAIGQNILDTAVTFHAIGPQVFTAWHGVDAQLYVDSLIDSGVEFYQLVQKNINGTIDALKAAHDNMRAAEVANAGDSGSTVDKVVEVTPLVFDGMEKIKQPEGTTNGITKAAVETVQGSLTELSGILTGHVTALKEVKFESDIFGGAVATLTSYLEKTAESIAPVTDKLSKFSENIATAQANYEKADNDTQEAILKALSGSNDSGGGSSAVGGHTHTPMMQ